MDVILLESDSVGPKPKRFSVAWLMLPILGIAIFFRVQHFADISYWFDESFCLKMVEFPVLELLHRAGGDPHPPLFYLLLKPWVWLFGTSPLAARSLSLIPGLGTVIGIFLVVREAYRDENDERAVNAAALAAAALVALSPLLIAWSFQVRMYALGTMLSAFSSWFVLRALRREPPRTLDWWLFTLTATALGYTHFFGLLTVTAQYLFAGGYVILQKPPSANASVLRRLRPVCLSAICTGLAWLLWLPSFLHQRQLVVEGFWTQPFSWEILGVLFLNLFDLNQAFDPNPVAGLIIGQVSLMAVLILVLGRRPGDLFLGLGASLPFFIGIVESAVSRNILDPHYFMFAHLYLLATFAVLICRVPWRLARGGGFGLAVAGMAFLAWKQHEKRDEYARFPGMRAAMAHVDSCRKSDEPLIVCDPAIFTSVIAHATKRDGVFAFFPGYDYPFTHGAAVMRKEEYLATADINDGSFQSAWVFDADTWGWSVPMPVGWRQAGATTFPEFNCLFVLRLYLREEPRRDTADFRATLSDNLTPADRSSRND